MPISMDSFDSGKTMAPDEIYVRKGTGKPKVPKGSGFKQTCPWCDKLVTGLYSHLEHTCTSLYMMYRFDRLPGEYKDGGKMAWKPEWERKIEEIKKQEEMMKVEFAYEKQKPYCRACRNVLNVSDVVEVGIVWRCCSCGKKVTESVDGRRWNEKSKEILPDEFKPNDSLKFAKGSNVGVPTSHEVLKSLDTLLKEFNDKLIRDEKLVKEVYTEGNDREKFLEDYFKMNEVRVHRLKMAGAEERVVVEFEMKVKKSMELYMKR